MEAQQQEIEINFKLDTEGRTARSSTSADQSNNESPEKDEATQELSSICYDSKSILLELWSKDDKEKPPQAVHPSNSILDELLFDCEISDCGLMPRTFWVSSKATPRCNLEQMAMDIFQHHTASKANFDPNSSGVEWWVQIRPSPEKTGRYAMHAPPDDNKKDMSLEGISFHWDKDEDLRILCGGNTYVHPHLSTVTYLTDIGAPTLALNYRVHNLTGEYIHPSSVGGFLSWPKFGKHLSFDGRYLHAAPANLMEEEAFEKQIKIIPGNSNSNASDLKKLQRRHRRVTFLVNIWLNYKPFGVQPFPDTMIGKLSGHDQDNAKLPKVGFRVAKDTQQAQSIVAKDSLSTFRWPMGDCNSDEFIQVDVPLDEVRKEASQGGSIEITWHNDSKGVRLCRNTKEETTKEHSPSGHQEEDEKDAKRPKLEQT